MFVVYDRFKVQFGELWERIWWRLIALVVPWFQKLLRIDCLNDLEVVGGKTRVTCVKLIRGGIFELPFSLGRTVRGVQFCLFGEDPFLQALKNQDSKNFAIDLFANEIAEIYEEETELRIGEKVPVQVTSDLASLPLWAMAYPWEKTSPLSKVVDYPAQVYRNRISKLDNLTVDNSLTLSPYQFGMSHALQFASLLKSIESRGFIKTSYLPSVYILKHGSRWRWIMSGSGNHRAYILHHLGFRSMPAQIVGVVDIDNISSLPLVKAGVFSAVTAELIFESVFRGVTVHRGIV